MTIISNYRLNTRYTGLKQLPNKYTAGVQIGGSYGYSLGVTIASANITVPAGAYVETPLIQTSLDSGIRHLAHEITHFINNNARIVISLNQTASNNYQLKVALTNTASSNIAVPSATINAILRLAESPFTI